MKQSKIKIIWPNNITTIVNEGDDWFSAAEVAGIEIPTGCLTGSCGACEIDVNGETVRACISNIQSETDCSLSVAWRHPSYFEDAGCSRRRKQNDAVKSGHLQG